MTTNSLAQAAGPRPAGRREWTALSVLMLPLLLVSMDVSVLFFAIPAISTDLDPTGTQQLWIFDIYGFVLAGLLMTMGALGDRFGHRRLLLIGAAAFGAASVTAAYADSAEMLIAARAVLGLGGATLMPCTMALIRPLFPRPEERAKAIALWSGVMTGGVALGSVMSGLLVQYFWWGSVFLVNLPAMLMLLLCAPFLVPEEKNPDPAPFDLISVPLSMGAVLPLVYGIKEIPSEGFETRYVLSLLVGAVFAVAFVWRQRTARHPLIPPALFRGGAFGSAVVLLLVATFGMMGSAFFTTQYLQSVLGKSAMEASLWSLLPSVLVGVAAPVSSALVQRGVNRAFVVAGGFAVSALGYVLLVLSGTDSLWLVLAACGILAAGIVTVMSQMTDLALGAAPEDRTGTASSLLETGQEFGGALGMAVLGSIGTAVYRGGIPDAAPLGARDTLGGALAIAARMPGDAGDSLAATARQAFTDGMHAAGATAAAILLAAAVLAALTLRKVRPMEQDGGEGGHGTGAASSEDPGVLDGGDLDSGDLDDGVPDHQVPAPGSLVHESPVHAV